jgi:hypothetical protein
MIKVQSQDTIIDILSKINSETSNDIIIEFPFWHPILHNYLSLKIIKNKAGTKKVTIITSDLTSRKIGKLLWIHYSIIKDQKFHEEKNTQKALLSYNFTFFEYALFELRKYWRELKENIRESKWMKFYSLKYEKQKSRIWFFLFWLLISIILIIFIFYFAVTKTYISIAPEVKIKTRGKNIIFREAPEDSLTSGNNVVGLRKISKTVHLNSTFWATGIDMKEVERSKGSILLYNLFEEDIDLREKTRLETASGSIFLTTKKISVPKAVKLTNGTLKPWTMEVMIESDIKDINGRMIWTEANIGTGEVLLLPWLKQEKDKMYAKALWAFNWGKSYEGKRIVTQQDVENAKNLLIQKLKDTAIKELKTQIRDDNTLNNVTYDLVWIDSALVYSDEKVDIPSTIIVWKSVWNFELSGTIKLTGYTYNKDSVINKLKNVVAESTIEWSEKIMLIDEKTLRFATVISRQENPLEFKSTMEIDAFIVHDFLNSDDTYVQKLKDMIAWMPESEARKVLLNDSKISNVSIEITPFFINNVSTRTSNIIFKLVDKMN